MMKEVTESASLLSLPRCLGIVIEDWSRGYRIWGSHCGGGETPLEVQVFIEMFITPALNVMMME